MPDGSNTPPDALQPVITRRRLLQAAGAGAAAIGAAVVEGKLVKAGIIPNRFEHKSVSSKPHVTESHTLRQQVKDRMTDEPFGVEVKSSPDMLGLMHDLNAFFEVYKVPFLKDILERDQVEGTSTSKHPQLQARVRTYEGVLPDGAKRTRFLIYPDRLDSLVNPNDIKPNMIIESDSYKGGHVTRRLRMHVANLVPGMPSEGELTAFQMVEALKSGGLHVPDTLQVTKEPETKIIGSGQAPHVFPGYGSAGTEQTEVSLSKNGMLDVVRENKLPK
jgi:hypothetical protein